MQEKACYCSQKKSKALGLWSALGCFLPCCHWPGSVDGADFLTTRGVLWGKGGDVRRCDLSNP